jgi:hypothetical protein
LYDLVAIPSLWQSWMIRMTNGFDMLWHNDICWGLTLCPVAHLEGAALKLGMGWRFGGWWLIYVDICWYMVQLISSSGVRWEVCCASRSEKILTPWDKLSTVSEKKQRL